MKLTITATFDPFKISAVDVHAALITAGIPEADITTGRARERNAKAEKAAKVKA